MDPPTYQELSYYDHVKKRHEEKGCLYAACCNGAVVSPCAAASAATKPVNAALICFAAAAKAIERASSFNGFYDLD